MSHAEAQGAQRRRVLSVRLRETSRPVVTQRTLLLALTFLLRVLCAFERAFPGHKKHEESAEVAASRASCGDWKA